MATKAAKIATTTATTMAATTKQKNKKLHRIPAPTQVALELFSGPSSTDVNGSYTGKPKNKNEMPVQDADDL